MLLAQAAHELGEVGPGDARRRHREDLVARLDERQRAVLEVGRRVGLGVDLRELLELERPLARGGVVEGAAEDRALVEVAAGLGEPGRLVFDGERRGEGTGNVLERRAALGG